MIQRLGALLFWPVEGQTLQGRKAASRAKLGNTIVPLEASHVSDAARDKQGPGLVSALLPDEVRTVSKQYVYSVRGDVI